MMTESNQHNATVDAACPICRSPVPAGGEHAPFCSKRCKQIDLGKWLGGDYTISRAVEERDLDEG